MSCVSYGWCAIFMLITGALGARVGWRLRGAVINDKVPLSEWQEMEAEIARLRELMARAYMMLQRADVPRDPWHWEVCTILNSEAKP